MEDPASQLAAQARRPRLRYRYTIPEKSRVQENDPRVVEFQQILMHEDASAIKASTASGTLYIFEAIKYSLVSVDGRDLDWATGDRDIIERVSAKVRELLVKGCRKVNTPSAEEEDAFFASEVVAV
jgi:hypothetical protein